MYRVVRRQHVEVQVHTSADAATVYALLRDGATWPTWSPIDSFRLERAGDGEPEGPGAIRIFRKGRVTGRDQIVSLVPDRRFSYRHLTGLPVRDYRGMSTSNRLGARPGFAGTSLSHRSCPAPDGCGVGGSGDL
ncbi:MAG: SRPBCC family protein [Pseudonocardiaceae bacterium]